MSIKVIALFLYGIMGLSGWFYYNTMVTSHYSDKCNDTLSSDLTVSYVRAMVWYHSRGKLQELRSILLNDDLSKRDRIEIRIKNMLMHRSSAYIRDFNSLENAVSNLGDWYNNNFDFESFLSEVFDIVFDSVLTVDDKMHHITDVMEKYQNITNSKLVENINAM